MQINLVGVGMFKRSPEYGPLSGLRILAAPALVAGGLMVGISCSPATDGTHASGETSAIIAPQSTAKDGCLETPDLKYAINKLIVNVDQHNSGQYTGVSGFHTTHEGQDWNVGQGWSFMEDEYHWTKDAPATNYILRNGGVVVVNSHPYPGFSDGKPTGGEYFKDEDYTRVCDPSTIDQLSAILEPLPHE